MTAIADRTSVRCVYGICIDDDWHAIGLRGLRSYNSTSTESANAPVACAKET